MCVDYDAELEITLPRNRHHFAELLIVTAPRCERTIQLAEIHGCQLHVTDAFWRNEGHFRKALAIEESLDVFGRHGWMCFLDADIVWPHTLPEFDLTPGFLYCPRRRMMAQVAEPPPEDQWRRFKLNPEGEFPSYSQIFWAEDARLPQGSQWLQTDWIHAGGYDSAFQARWPLWKRVRPPFNVLHMGEAWANWCGRSPDGRRLTHQIIQQRRRTKSMAHERK